MPRNRRITDIRSKKHKRKEHPKILGREEKAHVNFPFVKFSIAVISIAVIVGVGALHVFFASAQLSIVPETRTLETNAVITASVQASSVSMETLTIPARLFEKEIEITRLFPSTGSDATATRANGIIKVFNERTVKQILVANTRFVSENGMLFHIAKRVVIAPATEINGKLTPGSLNVEVVAAESGSASNIGSSNFSLPGLAGSSLYTLVYGKSSDSMRGGSVGQTSVVTAGDIEKAKEELVAIAIRQAKDAIIAELPSSFTLSDSAFFTEVEGADTLVKAGAAFDQFNYTVVVSARAIAFQKEQLNSVARELLNLQLGKGELLNEQTLNVQYEIESMRQGSGTAQLRTVILAVAYKDIDIESAQASILGKTISEVERKLRAQEGISNFTLSFWPFWVQSVPVDAERVQVRLILD